MAIYDPYSWPDPIGDLQRRLDAATRALREIEALADASNARPSATRGLVPARLLLAITNPKEWADREPNEAIGGQASA